MSAEPPWPSPAQRPQPTETAAPPTVTVTDSNSLAVTNGASIQAPSGPWMVSSKEMKDTLKATVCPAGTTDAELMMFLATCNRLRLDPFSRQLYMLPTNSGKKTIQISIDGLRAIAERTGQYDGQDEVTFTYDEAKDPKHEHPLTATARIYRKGISHPITATVHWNEYVKKNKEGYPNEVWGKMPHAMLSKVAESVAIRKAFPNDLSGVYTREEMDQANAEPLKVEAKVINVPPQPNGNGQRKGAW